MQWRLSDGGLWMRAKPDGAIYRLACSVRGRVSTETHRASGTSRKSGLRRRVIAVSDGRSGPATCPESAIPSIAVVLSHLGSITVVKAKHVGLPWKRLRSGCFHGRLARMAGWIALLSAVVWVVSCLLRSKWTVANGVHRINFASSTAMLLTSLCLLTLFG